jgi:hypothetical protein
MEVNSRLVGEVNGFRAMQTARLPLEQAKRESKWMDGISG